MQTDVTNPNYMCQHATGGFAKRPSGPRPATRDGPAAQQPGSPEAGLPSPDFPQFFCPAVNQCACTDPHKVWVCKMDDSEFEFVYHFNNHFNPFRPSLSLHVAK